MSAAARAARRAGREGGEKSEVNPATPDSGKKVADASVYATKIKLFLQQA